MKRMVIFDFPENFEFPEYWDSKLCTRCPLDVSLDDEPMCFLTGDCEYGPAMYDKKSKKIVHLPHPQCPFYGGAETVNCNDC